MALKLPASCNQALNTGSLAWSSAAALAYLYMVNPPHSFLILHGLRLLHLSTRFMRLWYVQVASWGGYSFIINLLPIHCLASIFTGRLTAKLYIAYAPLIILGTLEAGDEVHPAAH